MDYCSYKVFGLKRSGNHAILNWMIGLDPQNILFFNNVKPNKDLLRGFSPISVPDVARAYGFRENGHTEYRPHELERFRNDGGCLLTSYESLPVNVFDGDCINCNIRKEFGEFSREIKILIIRDPFNLLASTEKMILNKRNKYPSYKQALRRAIKGKKKKDRPLNEILAEVADLWVEYARLSLLEEERSGLITIIFDRWVVDKDYRDYLASRMGWVNQDFLTDFVSDAGGGSSFKKLELNSENTVCTLDRASEGSQSSVWPSVVLDKPALLEYTELLFGEKNIPGWV